MFILPTPNYSKAEESRSLFTFHCFHLHGLLHGHLLLWPFHSTNNALSVVSSILVTLLLILIWQTLYQRCWKPGLDFCNMEINEYVYKCLRLVHHQGIAIQSLNQLPAVNVVGSLPNAFIYHIVYLQWVILQDIVDLIRYDNNCFNYWHV